MDNTRQVFATGGASGGIAVIIYVAYKFLTTHHRLRSVCCGRTIDIETEATSPVSNSQTSVEDARTNKIPIDTVVNSSTNSRRSSTTKSENTSGVPTN